MAKQTEQAASSRKVEPADPRQEVESLAREIYARMIVGGRTQTRTLGAMAAEAFTQAEAFVEFATLRRQAGTGD